MPSKETAYGLIQKADYWINVGSATTLDELKAVNPKFADAKAVNENAFAWARVHGKPENEYPHTTNYCYETMSNIEGWKGKTERED